MTIETLRHIPLFESLDDAAALALSGLLVTRELEPYKVVFRAGDPGDAMYVIEEGRIQISVKAPDGPEVTLAELGPGEFFGEMALLDGKTRSANATTIEETRLGVLSREHFASFISDQPKVALQMLTATS